MPIVELCDVNNVRLDSLYSGEDALEAKQHDVSCAATILVPLSGISI
jgi:hypothetical protein